MSFISAFLKSTAQPLSISGATVATPKTQLITQVDLTRSIILDLGIRGAEGGGFISGRNHSYLDFSDSTHARSTVLADPSAGTVIHNCVVLEFVKFFLKQNVYWNTIDLNGVQTTNTLATGIISTKAFLVASGFGGDYTTPASLNDGSQLPTLSYDRATGIVTADRITTGCTLRCAFWIVDPR
jgi:hypothetical protein